MRPLRIKSIKNINRKIPKKKYLCKKKQMWGSSHIPSADLEHINQVLYKRKTQLAKSNYCSWKVMPKDSCEIYKKRYKRQVESRRKSRHTNETEISDDSENKESIKRKSTRRSQRCWCRQQRHRRRNSLPHYTTSETSVYSSETETSN